MRHHLVSWFIYSDIHEIGNAYVDKFAWIPNFYECRCFQKIANSQFLWMSMFWEVWNSQFLRFLNFSENLIDFRSLKPLDLIIWNPFSLMKSWKIKNGEKFGEKNIHLNRKEELHLARLIVSGASQKEVKDWHFMRFKKHL